MERHYLKFRDVPGLPLLVNFNGRLELRPAMEGASGEQMVIEKFGGAPGRNLRCTFTRRK